MKDIVCTICVCVCVCQSRRAFSEISLPNYPDYVGFGFSNQTWPNWDVTSNHIHRLTKRNSLDKADRRREPPLSLVHNKSEGVSTCFISIYTLDVRIRSPPRLISLSRVIIQIFSLYNGDFVIDSERFYLYLLYTLKRIVYMSCIIADIRIVIQNIRFERSTVFSGNLQTNVDTRHDNLPTE